MTVPKNKIILVDGTNPMAANLSLGGYKVTNLGAPSAAGDAANKSYVNAYGRFSPVAENQKDIGALYVYNGAPAVIGSQSGSLNLATAGVARTIPPGATHAVLRGGFGDMNAVGNASFLLYLAKNGTVLPAAGLAIALTNAAGSAEGSGQDTGSMIVPIAAVAPHVDWYLQDFLGGTITFIQAWLAIDGWFVSE